MKKRNYPYIPNSVARTKEEMMLQVGIKKIDELYADIPDKYRLTESLRLPEALSEFEVRKHVEQLLSKGNLGPGRLSFLGAGCWPHYVPAVVREISQRSELATAYTPYQPEISQGMLQTLFEYQSMICELTDMDVANCSMYDWASALAEAARMAARVKNRREILIPKIIHPERASTLKAYSEPAGISIRHITYDKESGQLNLADLCQRISDKTAAVYVENQSYFGFVEEQVNEICQEAHAHGALLIVGVDPTSLGVLRPPGEYGADVVIGEGQPLGNAMNFGGPSLGIMACREDIALIRQMPGRIIGLTTTQDNSKKGFCMTMQTREQHIRREKATSNICSNEALCAVAATVYLSLLGPEGLYELGEAIAQKTAYAIQKLSKIEGLRVPVFRAGHFKEFTINFNNASMSVNEVNGKLLKHNIQGGKDLSKEFPELGQTALCCTTETHSRADIDTLANTLGEILS